MKILHAINLVASVAVGSFHNRKLSHHYWQQSWHQDDSCFPVYIMATPVLVYIVWYASRESVDTAMSTAVFLRVQE